MVDSNIVSEILLTPAHALAAFQHGQRGELIKWLRGSGDTKLQLKLWSLFGVGATQKEIQKQRGFKSQILSVMLSHLCDEGHDVDHDISKTHYWLHALLTTTHSKLQGVSAHA